MLADPPPNPHCNSGLKESLYAWSLCTSASGAKEHRVVVYLKPAGSSGGPTTSKTGPWAKVGNLSEVWGPKKSYQIHSVGWQKR